MFKHGGLQNYNFVPGPCECKSHLDLVSIITVLKHVSGVTGHLGVDFLCKLVPGKYVLSGLPRK